MRNLLKYTISLTLFCATIPSAPAHANTFNTCTRNLLGTGINADAASIACANALSPTDLGFCVQRINQQVAIPPEKILQNCYQVRRPRELVTCVRNIDNRISVTSADLIVDNCRKSLLPIRYAQCVVGVSNQETALTPDQALSDCLAAKDFPSVIFPSSN